MTGMQSLSLIIKHQKDLTQRSLSKINSDVQRAAIICCIESGTLEAQVISQQYPEIRRLFIVYCPD